MTDKKVKPVLKEKFVIIYEGFFKVCQNIPIKS